MKTLNDFVVENPELFRQEELILEITELLARVMEQNGVTKADIARKLKKTKPFVSQCLSGEQNLTLRTVADLFGALGYKMQVGATAIEDSGKAIHRLYPIGGWSFEQSCGITDTLIDCAASEEIEIEEEVFPEAA
jgi:transcriptional regulator with XRE-family HTH domain